MMELKPDKMILPSVTEILIMTNASARLVSNYKDFVTRLIDFAKNAISKINDPDLEKEFEGILETPFTDEDGKDNGGKYKDLLNGRFKLTKVLRVERKNDADDISGKVADFTQETIKQLIEKGEHDALELFESKY